MYILVSHFACAISQMERMLGCRLTQIIGSEPSDGVWASTVNMSFIEVQGKILEADRARDQLLVSNMRLVFSVANKYTGHGLSFSELVQV